MMSEGIDVLRAIEDLESNLYAVRARFRFGCMMELIWVIDDVPVVGGRRVINEALSKLDLGWFGDEKPDDSRVSSRKAETAREEYWIFRNHFESIQEILERGISIAESIHENPLIVDAHVCLVAIRNLIGEAEHMHSGVIDDDDDECEFARSLLVDTLDEAKELFMRPLLLAAAKLQISTRSHERPSQLLALRDLAKCVHRSERTLEKYRIGWPQPDVKGAGNIPDRWEYARLRPILEEQFPDAKLPDTFQVNGSQKFRPDT